MAKERVTISGATAAIFAIPNAQAADAANAPGYTVVVTNGLGSATSNAATLAITSQPPVITIPPASQSVNAGQTVTFSVVASGSNPISYQWRKNGVSIAGATSSVLTLANVQGWTRPPTV